MEAHRPLWSTRLQSDQNRNPIAASRTTLLSHKIAQRSFANCGAVEWATDHSPNQENHKALVEEETGTIDPNESLAQR